MNIGNGTHGASNDLKLQRYTGSAWADATSVDAVGNYDPGEWTDNGFTFAGQGRFRCDSPGKFNVGTSYSLQMLIDAKASEQISGTGVTTHAYPFAAQNQTFAFDIRRTDNNLYWCVLSAQSDYSKYPYMSGGTYDYITAIMDGVNNKQALFSGTAIPSSGTGYKTDTAKSYNDTGFALGGYGKTATAERFVGTLKDFRQYDHALTAAEVAQNRKVDDWRYFGKFAETDVIVQSTHPALQGNEPDGEYDVDGSHTFTAPANVTIKVNGKEIEYACAGYTVESGMWDTRGPAWTVPSPARKSGPFDFAVRTECRRVQGAVPQFAAEAKIVAEFCPKGHALEGVGHKGEPCIHVAFPRARTVKGSRVFDYTVEAIADGMPSPVVSRIVAAGFAYPEECADLPGECLLSATDLPHDRPIRFTVTPRDCFGLSGKPLMNICRDRREPL